MKQRFGMTEEEADQMSDIDNEFYREFSQLVARTIDKCPSPDLEELMMMRLEDQTSVHGSDYERYRAKKT